MSARGKTLLVVSAHPDDEVLGCGATVALRVAQGWEAHLLIVATGAAGRHADPGAEPDAIRAEVDALRRDVERSSRVLGFRSWRCLDFPDNRLDTVSRMDLAHAIAPVVRELRPDELYTQHPGDYNWDHARTFDAVLMAARCNPGDVSADRILTFEVGSSTERAWQEPGRAFHPNVYVNVERTIDKKKEAMMCYRSEARPYPHPRSLEGIEYAARRRGLEVGLAYAEAFHLVRHVER